MKLYFSKSHETLVMKYRIICPCPEVAITSWQLFVSTRPQTVLTWDVKEGSAAENWFQELNDTLQMLTRKFC